MPTVEGADRLQPPREYSICSQTVIRTKTLSFDIRLLRPPVARETSQVCACMHLSLCTCIACDWQHLCESDSSNGAPDVLPRPLYLCFCCPGLLKRRWAVVVVPWQAEVIFDPVSVQKYLPTRSQHALQYIGNEFEYRSFKTS